MRDHFHHRPLLFFVFLFFFSSCICMTTTWRLKWRHVVTDGRRLDGTTSLLTFFYPADSCWTNYL